MIIKPPHPLDGALITVETSGHPDPSKRCATFKIVFKGERCTERAHAATDYLRQLVDADRARESLK